LVEAQGGGSAGGEVSLGLLGFFMAQVIQFNLQQEAIVDEIAGVSVYLVCKTFGQLLV
jgi:hypothetical protein